MMTGTWTPLANLAPTNIGTMMLLSDGTVMAQGNGITNAWYKLSPDAAGSYVKGNWSAQASMSTSRLYFGSNVLPSGKVMVLGGEYANGSTTPVWINTGETYDPVTNTWTAMPNFPQPNFGDDPTVVLPNGKILAGYMSSPQTFLFDPATSTWSQAGTKLRTDQSDEETWTMLPDGSILSYDIFSSISTGTATAQRYIPATNTWIDAGTLPAPLSNTLVGEEMGPSELLPDGRVLEIGANGNTAIYTPATNSWVPGPTIPNGKGADDAPGAILPDGHVIFAADTPLFTGQTQLFDFDPTTNTITQMTALPAALTTQLGGPSFVDRMLVLPSGQLLLTTSSNQLWAYTPGGLPSDAWRPTISSISGRGPFVLTGTQLTGISEGASYGDDAEMSTNYPIVQLTDSTGHVFYARTTNWAPGVATGAASTSVQFDLPAGLPQAIYSLRVIANGIASAPVSFNSFPGLDVASSTPANGSLLSTAPTSFVINFNEPIQPASLQAGALTVNGIPANNVTLDATNQAATFTFNTSPVTVQGAQSMAIAANSIIGQDGSGIFGYSASFNYFLSDIVMGSAQATGTTALTLTYQVTGNTTSPFRIGFYNSADANFDARDAILGTVPVSDPTLLTVGSHSLTVPIGTGTGQVPLPGAGLPLPSSSFYVLAVANDNNAVPESSLFNNTAPLVGAYHAPGGDVVVQGSDSSDTIAVDPVGGSDFLIVNSLGVNYAVTDVAGFDFYAHGGNDDISGSGVGKPMQFFAGPGVDTMAGGSLNSTLIGPDQANAWTLAGANAGTLNGGSFGSFANLTGGTSSDTFTIKSGASLSGQLDGRGGTNTLDYSLFGSPVSVNLATQTANALSKPWLNINAASGSTATNTLTAADSSNVWSISGSNAGSVNGFAFTAFPNLLGGAASDAFLFVNGGSVSGTIDGKAGANSLNFSGDGKAATVNLQTRTATGIGVTWANIQSAAGTSSTDTLVGANTSNTWSITGLNSGNLNGTFAFTGFVNLTGGTAPDTFRFSNAAGVTGQIDGQASTNTLDYSAYTTGIYVNLLTASATGTGGLANIANVTGGQGNDILVGDNNANVLIETAGRNLIIGEGGKDTLTAGSGGDLLIGGRTAFDTNVAALDALLATWSRTDLSYAARIAALQSGVSYVDSTGPHTAALNASTVFDDAASDILNGGSGQDWFFVHTGSNSDTVSNVQSGEVITNY